MTDTKLAFRFGRFVGFITALFFVYYLHSCYRHTVGIRELAKQEKAVYCAIWQASERDACMK